MIRNLLLLGLIFVKFNVLAQIPNACPRSTISLFTQADVEKFALDYPNPTFPNSLTISANYEALNLSSLSYLTSIQGCLEIVYNVDLAGLKNLESVGGEFSVLRMPIENFDKLEKLKTIGGLRLHGNGRLKKLFPFTSTVLYNLIMDNNPVLTDLSELGKITKVTNTLTISGSNNTNLNFFTNLSFVQFFAITNNKNLTNIDVINNNITVLNDVSIYENPLLSECSLFLICNLIARNRAVIFSNAPGCNSKSEVSEICDSEIIFPVTLINFSAAPKESMVELNWATSSERNSKNFQVQHSLDSKNWKAVGVVDAHGASDVLNNYTFKHFEPSQGVNYYRLKMIDLDETFAYSSIVSVNLSTVVTFAAYPNPASKSFKILSSRQDVSRVQLFNVSGKLVLNDDYSKGQVDVRGLKSGVYSTKVYFKNGEIENFNVAVVE